MRGFFCGRIIVGGFCGRIFLWEDYFVGGLLWEDFVGGLSNFASRAAFLCLR